MKNNNKKRHWFSAFRSVIHPDVSTSGSFSSQPEGNWVTSGNDKTICFCFSVDMIIIMMTADFWNASLSVRSSCSGQSMRIEANSLPRAAEKQKKKKGKESQKKKKKRKNVDHLIGHPSSRLKRDAFSDFFGKAAQDSGFHSESGRKFQCRGDL